MTSTREAVLAALKARLDTIDGPDIYRNEPLPKRVSEGGMLALFDGDPGEPDVLMSPLTYLYEHTAEIEVLIERKDNAERQTAFDALLRAVATAVHADRTLGGLCDWIEA
ncbi:MAG: acyl-CoA transferase, partial [Pseudomonadota bacterium]